MKKIPIITLVSLFIATTALPAALTNLLSAKITGTALTQIVLDPADGRIGTSHLSNARVFEEFNVSPADYLFVFSTSGGDAGFYLVPKHASSVLPTLPVVILGNGSQTAVDTKTRTFAYQSNVQTNTITNLFENLSGTISGTLKYTGSFPPASFSSATFVFIGHGTDVTNDGTAILNLKLTARGNVTQLP